MIGAKGCFSVGSRALTPRALLVCQRREIEALFIFCGWLTNVCSFLHPRCLLCLCLKRAMARIRAFALAAVVSLALVAQGGLVRF